MFKYQKSFASYSVKDIPEAHRFYSEKLGLKTETPKEPGLILKLSDDTAYLYPKPNHEPANFTVMNFKVADIEASVDELSKAGIRFEQYPELKTDAKGISRDPRGPLIAWFKDPSGNILSVVQDR